MADTERRIVVEGVEFAHLVEFPKILRAVTAAFQPARLIMGLLIVVALMTAGRVWDGVFTPAVAPSGLLAASWTPQDTASSQEALQAALRNQQVPESDWPEGELAAADVAELVQVAYGHSRGDLVAAAGDEDGAKALEQADEAFLRALEQIDAVRPRGMFEATATFAAGAFNTMVKGLIFLKFDRFYGGIRDLLIRMPIAAWNRDPLFTVAYGLIFVVLIALGGGAISRSAATEIAQGEKLRLQQTLDFALGSWRRLIFSLVLPLLIAGVLSALLLVGGFFLFLLPWVDVVGGLFYGVALLIGFGVVFLLVGYAAGFSLLIPAVACENCDAADAQQRAYAYVLSRPLHLLGYGFVCFVGLAVGFVVAGLFAVAILNVTGALVDAATSNAAVTVSHGFSLFDLRPHRAAAIPLAMHSEWSAGLVMLWQTLVVCLVAGYVFSYYFSASTVIYLLMRRACDGQEMTEIWEAGAVPGTAVDEPDGEDEDGGGEDAGEGGGDGGGER